MDNKTLVLPDFLGIGAVKAGTTWLYEILKLHPEVYLPPAKPVYYFDKHKNKPIESYSRIFWPGRDKLKGEFTSSYCYLPNETIRMIRKLIPKLKIILILREYKSRDWSEAKMEFSVVRGLGQVEISDEEYLEFLRSDKCVQRGNYINIIKNWKECFPVDQIFIGLYDEIKNTPKVFAERVFNFLQISTDIDWDSFPLNEHIFKGIEKSMPQNIRKYLDNTYSKKRVEELGNLIGINLIDKWGY